MNPREVYCANEACADKYAVGKGNIVAHRQKRQRCKCRTCGQTFAYQRGTLFYGLRHPEQLVVGVVGLVAWGCPVAAIVAVFGLDERTVAEWLRGAGVYAEAFHHQQMRQLDMGQVQVDELRLKIQGGVVWIAMALAISSRLWLGAVCSLKRDTKLARQIMTCIYNWACQHLPLAFDGWTAYPSAALKVFREPLLTGRVGAPRLLPWPTLTLAGVVKASQAKGLSLKREVVSGSPTVLRYLLNLTQPLHTSLNTAYIERLNATFRAHLAIFARRTRCPARQLETVGGRVFLVGCLYNFCTFHSAFQRQTPAMAAALTDHRWSLSEFFGSPLKPFRASTV